MKRTIIALLFVSTTNYGMQKIEKDAFHPDSVKGWDALTTHLIESAPTEKIDVTQGLAAIFKEMNTQTASVMLDDQQIITRANEILSKLPDALSKFADQKSLSPMEKTKLALTALLAEGLAKHQQELKLPTVNTLQKIISSGDQAFRDNLELMQLNSNLDPKKCSTEVKAFMALYFYLGQQKNSK